MLCTNKEGTAWHYYDGITLKSTRSTKQQYAVTSKQNKKEEQTNTYPLNLKKKVKIIQFMRFTSV